MTTNNRPLRVFLCHSSADKPAVRELYQKLRAEPWIEPWLDEEELYPGDDWDLAIKKAVEESDVVLICLSNGSINKRGYVQKELRFALDIALEIPEEEVFIIPLRLEECIPPRSLRDWHYADYFEGNRERALQRLLVSLKRRADSLGLKPESPASVSQISNLTKKVEQEINQVQDLTYVPSSTNILSNGITLIHVPAGKFLMGDDKLTIDIPYDYWITRFPVTNTQYSQFIKIDFEKGKEDHPVIKVSWDNTMKYCKWLNQVIKAELPSDAVLRLPTEAEWEKAARGTNGLEYPWGNQFDKNNCNTNEGGMGDTTLVGLYSPRGDSPYGCADMSGNIWEWTHSLFKPYPYSFKDGREDENATGARVLRGGSFNSGYKLARCAYRSNSLLNLHYHIGYRLVASPTSF